ELIKGLDHPAHSERLRCQRALIAKGETVAEPVAAAVEKGILAKQGLRHGIWVLAMLRSPNSVALDLLKHPDAEVRIEAVRAYALDVPEFRRAGGGAIMNNAAALARLQTMQKADPDARVRFQVACLLNSQDGKVALHCLETEQDPWVRA